MLGVKIERKKEIDYFEVLPENWLAINIFTDVSTQWRTDSGQLIGLDYNALRWIFELKKRQNTKSYRITCRHTANRG